MKKKVNFWLISLAALSLVILLTGALYAQNMRPWNRGGGGMHEGPGMGQRMDSKIGFGMNLERGHMGLMAYFMRDDEVRELAGQIMILSKVNELGLSKEQVQTLLKASKEAQGIVDKTYGGLLEDVKTELRKELDNVLKGGKVDRDAFEAIKDKVQASHKPGELRDQLKGIIDRVMNMLTEEQRKQLNERPERADDRPGFRNRSESDDSDDKPRFEKWRDSMTDDQKKKFDDRFEKFRENIGEGKIMMFLLSPETIPALELWLKAKR